ncbi:hypothetical protein Leryth_011593 [Lithospermum erythrorhizon]|nr:hypothetical protein Leryth_011593 [Lithospermum erythrorhizon]
MEETSSLTARIHQLERERDALHKDIEQLCMQQAGAGYLGVATRMHFQRTAGLEQEIDNLKMKLSACTRENQNLRQELSQAFHIKTQLADLHNAQLEKTTEAEKQLKFFQACVAAAFSERDNAIMEAEKSKEKEELMSQELNKVQKRFEDLTSEILEEREFSTKLRIDLEKQEKRNETFRKVIDKFYDSREHDAGSQDITYEDKCEYLLGDTEETSTSNQNAFLEEEIESLRSSLDNLQYQLRVGVQIENHLQKRIRDLEKDRRTLEERIMKGISILHCFHSQTRTNIMNLLHEEYSFMKSTVDKVEESIKLLQIGKSHKLVSPQSENLELSQTECRDVHISSDTGLNSPLLEKVNSVACSLARETDASETLVQVLQEKGKELSIASRHALETGDSSEALAQALQEKVATLLLLSQQEERYLLERNVQAAQQKKIEELQRNLLQVTNEKVKALMDLAQVKQKYQLLQEKISQEMNLENSVTEVGRRRVIQERDGKFTNLFKNSYLNRWVGAISSNESNAEAPQNHGGILSAKHSNFDVASMKIEYATLKESLESMEYLTSSTHRLRLSLLKVKQSVATNAPVSSLSESLDHIISEAMLVKTALSSSLPVSWSAEHDSRVSSSRKQEEAGNDGESNVEKVDFVSAAGFEMVELLIFAAQILKDGTVDQSPQTGNKRETPASTYD